MIIRRNKINNMKGKMKKAIIGLLLGAILLTAAGCGAHEKNPDKTEQGSTTATSTPDTPKPAETEPPEIYYTQIYDGILESAYALMLAPDDHDAADGEKDIFVMTTCSDALDCVGYCIQDISGDGIPELLIGSVTEAGDEYMGYHIFAVYTCVDGEPYLTFESNWFENSYYYLGDGSFFNEGFTDEMGDFFGFYDISPDGTELVCNDFYFTYQKENADSDIGYYRNQTGGFDPDDSEKLDLPDELFWQIEGVATDQVQNLPLTSFFNYAESTTSGTRKPAKKEPPTNDNTSLYDEILNSACALLLDPDDHEAAEGEKGIWEVATCYEPFDALNSVGYVIQDISGDGIPELLIGYIAEDETEQRSRSIYAMYTLIDNVPYLTFEGWFRSTYYYLEDGSIFNIGSDGAGCSLFGMYEISSDGTELDCFDFYFSHEKENAAFEVEYYRNQYGVLSPDDSEKLEISDELFWQIEGVAVDQAKDLALTPFADLLPGGAKADDETPVRIQWAEDAEPLTDYEEYTVSAAEPQVRIVFTAVSPVAGFSLLELTMESISEAGEVEFTATPALPQVSELLPGKQLVVGILFPENIPRYGFQYEDADGDIRRFALELSGKDGSLLIREADPAYYNFVLNSFGSAVE